MKQLKILLLLISIVNFEFIQTSNYDRKTLELMNKVNSRLSSEYSINEQSATAIVRLCSLHECLTRKVPLNPEYQPKEDFIAIFRQSYGEHSDKKIDKRLREAFIVQGCYILDSLLDYDSDLDHAVQCRPDFFANLKDFESSGCVIQQKKRGVPYKFKHNPFYDEPKQKRLQRTCQVGNKS